MKIGDKVKVIQMYGEGEDPLLIGSIGEIAKIDFSDDFPYEVKFSEHIDNKDHYSFTEDELELVFENIPFKKESDFSVIGNKDTTLDQFLAVCNWAEDNGYKFYRHCGFELVYNVFTSCNYHINFSKCISGINKYYKKYDIYCIDNNTQGIKITYTVEDFLDHISVKVEPEKKSEIDYSSLEGIVFNTGGSNNYIIRDVAGNSCNVNFYDNNMVSGASIPWKCSEVKEYLDKGKWKIINKTNNKNMDNKELERIIREGDMALAIHTNKPSLDNKIEMKTSLGNLKKRNKGVKFVSKPI